MKFFSLADSFAAVVLSGGAHPALLGWLAHAWRDHAERMERLALNPATDDRTFAFLASLPHRRVIDIVANNQTRLLRHPEIVDVLGDNPLTGKATTYRILAFLGLSVPQPRTERTATPRATSRPRRSPTTPR